MNMFLLFLLSGFVYCVVGFFFMWLFVYLAQIDISFNEWDDRFFRKHMVTIFIVFWPIIFPVALMLFILAVLKTALDYTLYRKRAS